MNEDLEEEMEPQFRGRGARWYPQAISESENLFTTIMDP